MAIIHSEYGLPENINSENTIKAIGIQSHSFFFVAYNADSILYAVHAEIDNNDCIKSANDIINTLSKKNPGIFENAQIFVLPDYSTLVPAGLFKDSDYDLVLGAVYNCDFNGKFFSNDIPFSKSQLISNFSDKTLELVNTFNKNATINNTCEAWLNKAIKPDVSDAVYVYFVEDFFYLAVVKQSKLLVFNKFSANEKNDFLYFLLGATTSCGLKNESSNAYICGDISKNSPLFTQISAYFKKVEFSLPMTFKDEESNNVSHHYFSFINK